MDILPLVMLWIAGLAIALAASEGLVTSLSSVGRDLGMSAGLLGLLVALGADAPEVTSALIALVKGAQDIGLGVIVGSNIYNLAGLLGLAAVLAGGIKTDSFRLRVDGGANALLTVMLLLLIWLPAGHSLLGAVMLAVLAGYVAVLAAGRARVMAFFGKQLAAPVDERGEEEIAPWITSVPRTVVIAVVSLVAIIAGSYLLVNTSISLAPKLHLPRQVMGIFILPVATSLPNTWAAVSLARKGLARAAIAATFSSNSINAAIGAGLPSLFLALHASHAARTIDAGWLVGMTLVAGVLLATRHTLARWEGTLLLALYVGFVVVRLTWFS